MDYKVILSPRSIQDLQEIVRYISFDNPAAAEQFGGALLEKPGALQSFLNAAGGFRNSVIRGFAKSSTDLIELFTGSNIGRK